MICSTGCSNYDYDRDAPIGITVQEFETNIDAYYYDGSYVMAQSCIESLNNEGIYTDENISILCIDFYNGNKKLIDSSEQIIQIVPGYVNSVLIQIPEDAEYYALQSYSVTSCRKINNITTTRSTELLSSISNTMSNVKKNTKDVIFLDNDMRLQ